MSETPEEPGWRPDPYDHGSKVRYRWHDGTDWTGSVADSPNQPAPTEYATTLPTRASVQGREAKASPEPTEGNRTGTGFLWPFITMGGFFLIVFVLTASGVLALEDHYGLVLVLMVVVALIGWSISYMGSDEAKEDQKRFAQEADYRAAWAAQDRTTPPACPACGGSQFKLRRTPGRRAGIGAATVAAGAVGAAAASGKQKVQCQTCERFFDPL